MAASALMLGGAYVAGTVVNQMNNQKKEEVLHKLQRKKIELLEEKNRWLIIKAQEEKRYIFNEKQISDLRLKIQYEEKAISKYEHAANDANTKFMVILGNTGDGKSTLCNRLCGDKSEYGDYGPFIVSDDAKSQTQKVLHSEHGLYVIVDTPGINDTEHCDDAHINDIVHYLYGSNGVNAFILVRNGTNIRFDANFQKMLNQYEGFFGERFWKHLIIVLTRIEGTQKERFIERNGVSELQNNLMKKYKIKHKIPVLTVGSDCYMECVNNIRKYVTKLDKFECNDLTSPIDEFRDELSLLIDCMDDFGANLIDDAQQNINRIDIEIRKIEDKISHPSQIPLIKSAVKSVHKSINNSIHNSIANYCYDR